MMPAPAGAPASRLKLTVCAGTSESVAVAVKVMRTCSLLVRFGMGFSAGGEFVFNTAMVTDWVALKGGTPLSVTMAEKL